MEKKNTVLLTVIAIATLLVAVVGATFAYFASNSSNDASATITTTTAKAMDLFKATGEVSLTVDANNSIMAEVNAGKANATDSKDIEVSLVAGSGTATCTYDLIWTPAAGEGYDTYAKTEGATKEYTLAITNAGSFTETNVDELQTILANDLPIETTSETSVTHTVTATFYNLEIPQTVQEDKTFGGTVTVGDVHCTNGGTVTYSERTGA